MNEIETQLLTDDEAEFVTIYLQDGIESALKELDGDPHPEDRDVALRVIDRSKTIIRKLGLDPEIDGGR